MKIIVVFCTLCASLLAQAPDKLSPPAEEHMIVRAHGVGDQIYMCKGSGDVYAWTLKAPDAQLMAADGQVTGRHFAGPTWEWKDKSVVVGKAVANVPSPDENAVPWLLIHIVQHNGEGALSPVATVQRVNTKGGKAPASGCDAAHAGEERRVHYEADYVFWGK